ncbi:MAG TPA: hypothetical protein DEP72_06340 [Clostridiales bacterium]|nr:MAG: hypothetical protein A2Y18_00135 [Clostridiales bacterium GWD2_32_19]HCC07757.1 hypothetical protein [Clostridiales bacterium]
MFGLTGIALYAFILVAKVLEVAVSTLRIILSSKGEKIKSSLVGLIEITLWIYVAAGVLKNMDKDPMLAIIYSIGFTLGVYFGGRLSDKLSLGNVKVSAIVRSKDGYELAVKIRSHNFAVTVFKGEGMNEERHLLIMMIKRKRLHQLIDLLKAYQNNIVIDYTEINIDYGAYGIFKK